MFLLPAAVPGTPVKPCPNFLSGLKPTSVDCERPRTLLGITRTPACACHCQKWSLLFLSYCSVLTLLPGKLIILLRLTTSLYSNRGVKVTCSSRSKWKSQSASHDPEDRRAVEGAIPLQRLRSALPGTPGYGVSPVCPSATVLVPPQETGSCSGAVCSGGSSGCAAREDCRAVDGLAASTAGQEAGRQRTRNRVCFFSLMRLDVPLMFFHLIFFFFFFLESGNTCTW